MVKGTGLPHRTEEEHDKEIVAVRRMWVGDNLLDRTCHFVVLIDSEDFELSPSWIKRGHAIGHGDDSTLDQERRLLVSQ